MAPSGESSIEIGGTGAAPDPGFAARMKAAAGTDL
jgi:hypothetical protein